MEDLTQQHEKPASRFDDDQDVSGLQFYSIALVTKTPTNQPSEVIEVTPIEKLTQQDTGPIAKPDKTYSQTHPEADGSYQSPRNIVQNNIIEATWLPLSDSNRDTAPCVYQDESVILYRYKDDKKKFYWSTVKRQAELRRKEMVRWSASNETAPLVPHTKSSSVFVELNALNKTLEIGTPVLGESVAYRLLMDFGNGQLDVSDNQGNSFIIQSTAGVITVNAKNKTVVNAPDIQTNGDSVTVNASKITLNGVTTVTQQLIAAGGLNVSGGGGKAFTVSGNMAVSGQIQAADIVSGSSSRGGVSGVSAPPAAVANQKATQATVNYSSLPLALPVTPGAITPAAAPPSDKSVRYDSVSTANRNASVLTGDARVDAPSLATGTIPKQTTPDVGGISGVQESVAKASVPGQQLTPTSSTSSGILTLVNNARSVQSSVSTTINSVTNTASSVVNTARATVIDPINNVSRTVSLTTGAVVSQIQGISAGLSNQVNGFLTPINSISRNLGGKGVGNIAQLNNLTTALNRTSNQVYSVSTLTDSQLRKVVTPVNSLANQGSGVINNANYAAVNVTQPMRTVTDSVDNADRSAQEVRRQLEQLADPIRRRT